MPIAQALETSLRGRLAARRLQPLAFRAPGISNRVPHGPRPWVDRQRVGAQKFDQRLTVAAGRCIDSANRRAAAKSEAATAICRPPLAVLGIQKVGRERTSTGFCLGETA